MGKGWTYDLLATSEHSELSEAHVERRAQICSIRLLNDDDIDSTGQRGRVDFAVELLEVPKHFVGDAEHVWSRLIQSNVTDV